jgi:hypothetical protein
MPASWDTPWDYVTEGARISRRAVYDVGEATIIRALR